MTACAGSTGSAPPDRAQVVSLLHRLGSAVIRHDRAAFLDGVDPVPAAAGFATAQGAQLSNLRRVPLAEWRYTLVAQVTDPGALRRARDRFGAATTIWQLNLVYRIRGYGQEPVAHALWWTFTRHGDGVVVAADDGLASQGGVSWRGPWDFGPMAVVRTPGALVLGEADQQSLLGEVATTVDDAVPQVSAVWGTTWARGAVVVVPATSAGLSAALGGAASDNADSAVTGGDAAAETVFDQAVDGSKVATVVVVPAGFARLTAFGRRVVLTHELTHVATGADTGDGTPRWLVEGFADYVAYRASDDNGSGSLPVTRIAAELATSVRAGRLPSALPSDSEFDRDSTSASAYEQAWLACRLIVGRAGTAGLVRFYRLVGTGQDTTAAALRAVVDLSPGGFVDAWRAYLSAELGRTR